jgi:glycosyltransferase involved in cell wall biosynthesis
MNIFQFSFGDGYAGSSKVALISSKILMQQGNVVYLFVSENSLTEKRAHNEQIDTFVFNTDMKFSTLLNKIIPLFDQLNPGIIISHHSLDRKIGLALKKKYKDRFVNIGYRHNISRTVPIIGSYLYNRFYDYLIACSQGVANSLTNSGIKSDKVKVIKNSITIPAELQLIDGRHIREKYFIQDNIVLGMSTWFHKERKGFDILFNAVNKLDDRFKLLLIGIPDGDKKAVLNFAAEFGINQNKIIMPGYVENVWEYYKAMDIFLLTSRSEGFSLALLEAAAAKLPIVASNIDGNNEFITNGKNGLLFDILKPDDLSDNIQKLAINNAFAKELAKNAYEDVMENYQLKNYTDSLNKLILSVTS